MNDSDSLMKEINDAMRQEKWRGFMGNFGTYIVLVTVLIIAATISYVLWQRAVEANNQQATRTLYHAITMMEDGAPLKAKREFEQLAKSEDEAKKLLAELWLVKQAYRSGQQEQAAQTAADIQQRIKGHEQYHPYHDWLGLLNTIEEKDGQPGGAFRLTNLERQAAAHMKNKELAKATAIYEQIANDSQTPPSMRSRAQMMLDAYLLPRTKHMNDAKRPDPAINDAKSEDHSESSDVKQQSGQGDS